MKETTRTTGTPAHAEQVVEEIKARLNPTRTPITAELLEQDGMTLVVVETPDGRGALLTTDHTPDAVGFPSVEEARAEAGRWFVVDAGMKASYELGIPESVMEAVLYGRQDGNLVPFRGR